MYKGSGGNPQCGRVAAVYDWKYLGGNVLGAPLDTGLELLGREGERGF